MKLKAFVLFAILCKFSLINSKSCKEFKIVHKFHPLRHCQRSNKSVIAFSNVNTVEECSELAVKRRGLAFNFSPKDRFKKNLFDVVKSNETKEKIDEEDFYSCEVLDCPEHRNFSSVINDTRYDYYSLYARPPPNENATCVPSVGMFIFFKERSNYSAAYNTCATIGGSLAHIASEARSVQLSSILRISTNSSTNERIAYVGLNETRRGEFFTSNSEPLSCFNFRAWAPNHPPKVRKPGCVAITPEASWKVFNCNRKLMFVCELFTSGPNPYVNNLQQKCTVKSPNNRFMPKKTSN